MVLLLLPKNETRGGAKEKKYLDCASLYYLHRIFFFLIIIIIIIIVIFFNVFRFPRVLQLDEGNMYVLKQMYVF